MIYDCIYYLCLIDRCFHSVSDSQELIAVVGLGEKKEISTNNVRLAIAKAVKSIKALDGKVDWKIQVQDFSKVLSQGAEIQTSIAEGSTLANYSFDQFKEAKKRSTPVSITSLATTLMNEWREVHLNWVVIDLMFYRVKSWANPKIWHES